MENRDQWALLYAEGHVFTADSQLLCLSKLTAWLTDHPDYSLVSMQFTKGDLFIDTLTVFYENERGNDDNKR